MDAGRAAESTKKLNLHVRAGLNANTVCVFSFEKSAYSKEIAEERKDTHSTQLTPEELCSVIFMRETFDLIARARLEIGEK